MEDNIYLEHSFNEMERLLGLVDKNPLSPTFGCFDKSFWHHRFTDFPSSARQQAVLCLAYFYTWNSNINPYFQSPQIFSLIEASLKFTMSIQKGDGSYDEWYPNERGWAGPTGYVSFALAKTYELLNEELSPEVKKPLKRSLLKSASFLAFGWEAHVLSNHIAMALLPIFLISQLFDSTRLKVQYKVLLEKFSYFFNKDEGWGVEYDGPDFGYQSATVSFLSRLYGYDKNPSLKKICERSLEFISFGCFPDHSFARKLGARQCEVLFHFGVEYWAYEKNSLAHRMALWSRTSLRLNKLLIPKDHEDHYFIYRMVEFVETAFLTMNHELEPQIEESLPYERENFRKELPKGKIFIQKKEDQYIVANLGRGGAFLVFDCSERKLLEANFGHLVKTTSGDLLTTLDFNKNIEYSIRDSHILIEGPFCYWKNTTFTPVKMILFRKLMLLFGWNHRLSYILKSVIRKILLNQNNYSTLLFKRKISLEQFGEFEDEVINNESIGIEETFDGGLFEIRYVPQSRYFKVGDLDRVPLSKDKVKN